MKDSARPALLVFFEPSDWDPSRAERISLYRRAAPEGVRVELVEGGAEGEELIRRCGIDASGGAAAVLLDADGNIRWSRRGEGAQAPHPDRFPALLADSVLPPKTGSDEGPFSVTRREFLGTAAVVAVFVSLPPAAKVAMAAAVAAPHPVGPGNVEVTLDVNGVAHRLQIEPRVTLLDALRERLGLTGSKKGCDHGQCGACTVHIDGKRVNSCLTLAMTAEGRKITTIEGLAEGDRLHPVQTAFIEYDAYQCGFCTPGQIMSAAALLNEPCGKSDADVRESMSGNLCRCAAYDNILAAVQAARGDRVSPSDRKGA